MSEPDHNAKDLHRRRVEGPERHQPVGLEGRAAGCPTRTTCCTASPPATRAPGAHCPGRAGAATCEVLFFGSDRFDNSGDAQQGFWFFQNKIAPRHNRRRRHRLHRACTQNGDLLVISDFSNGGTTSTITVYKWDTTCRAVNKPPADCGDANLRLLATSTNANCATRPARRRRRGSAASSTRARSRCRGRSPTRAERPTTAPSTASSTRAASTCRSSASAASASASVSETRSSTSTTPTLKDFVLGQLGYCETTLRRRRSSPTARQTFPPGGCRSAPASSM